MENTSASLLQDLRQSPATGDWTRFVKLYTPLLFFWTRKLGMSEADSADLIQDVFTILVQKLPTFQYDQKKGFRNWLRTIVLNKWRNFLRRKANTPAEAKGDDLNDVPDPETSDAVIEAEYRQHLMASALEMMQNEFPFKTWKACWEHVVMGRSAAEVAAELDIVVGSVYVAKARVLSRARQELMGLLD